MGGGGTFKSAMGETLDAAAAQVALAARPSSVPVAADVVVPNPNAAPARLAVIPGNPQPKCLGCSRYVLSGWTHCQACMQAHREKKGKQAADLAAKVPAEAGTLIFANLLSDVFLANCICGTGDTTIRGGRGTYEINDKVGMPCKIASLVVNKLW